MSQFTLKQYRNAIRAAWLPLVNRARLTSHEYAMTEQWFKESTPVNLILRAIAQVKERGAVVWSLGVIKSDLEALRRDQGRLQAGSHQENRPENWRDFFRADMAIQELLDDFPELGERIKQFLTDLPDLTEAEAKARWKVITS
jgi:hypothetical protein